MPIASSLLKKPRLVEKLRDFYKYVNNNNGKVGTKTEEKQEETISDKKEIAKVSIKKEDKEK